MSSLTPFKINTSKNLCTFCISLISGHLKSPIINTSVNFHFKLPRINTSRKSGGGGSSRASDQDASPEESATRDLYLPVNRQPCVAIPSAAPKVRRGEHSCPCEVGGDWIEKRLGGKVQRRTGKNACAT